MINLCQLEPGIDKLNPSLEAISPVLCMVRERGNIRKKGQLQPYKEPCP